MTFSPSTFATVKTFLGSALATDGGEPSGVARNLSQLERSLPLKSGFQSGDGCGATGSAPDAAVIIAADRKTMKDGRWIMLSGVWDGCSSGRLNCIYFQ